MKLPTNDDLKNMRKGIRKQRCPKIFDGLWASEPGIGGVKISADGEDFLVSWVTIDDDVRSDVKDARWSELCRDPAHEMKRLEVGYVFAALLELHAQRVMDSIGHPIASINESEPFRADAKRWRHWAIVPAGHMI